MRVFEFYLSSIKEKLYKGKMNTNIVHYASNVLG